ncbi:MAG: response regulator transcription factor [Pleomorphochaeta sp.]
MKILLVEDVIELANVVKEYLELEHYNVDIVDNGEDGYEYGIKDIYDVILLDIMLPKMSGIEVLKKIRENKINTPIIMLTAKSELEDIINGLDYGADDYITKPFEIRELLARIRSVSRRKEKYISDNLQFGNISLKKNSLEVTSTYSKINLSLKEYQLLEILLLNPNQTVLKEYFIEKIWGYDFDGEDNIVEVYISFLRKKLKFIKSSAKIKTFRGLGYCLELLND